jgi:hypothetical protein
VRTARRAKIVAAVRGQMIAVKAEVVIVEETVARASAADRVEVAVLVTGAVKDHPKSISKS